MEITAPVTEPAWQMPLWIAFKSVLSYGNHSPPPKLEAAETLWIAFKSVLSYGNHSIVEGLFCLKSVVNCFQISTFLWKSQLGFNPRLFTLRCELLSNQYFPMEITARHSKNTSPNLLWIAFKSVLSYGNHSACGRLPTWTAVVNCFQISTFLWKSQPRQEAGKRLRRCELLSNQYFPMEITAPKI